MVRYRTIVADPPWPYEGFASDPTSGRSLPPSRREHVRVEFMPYRELSLTEIAALPVADLADSDCRLFLWTTNRYLPDAHNLIRVWRFKYVQLLVWHKTGNPSPFGGSIAPNHAEYLLVAVTGKPKLLGRLPTNVIGVAAQRLHSQKPEHFLDMVEMVSPGPYVELFARRHRLGWDVWGDQSANTAELTV